VPAPRRSPELPRRIARLVPAQSPPWVLLHVVREVRDPAWTPAAAARRIRERVQDPGALRLARARLRVLGGERVTLSQARALATLNLAISDLEAGQDEPEDRRGARDGTTYAGGSVTTGGGGEDRP
jgi:hypothetical protein